MSLDAPPAGSRHVLFATAEFGPFVKVGGLGEASAGLSRGLDAIGLDVEVVMPDYGLAELHEVDRFPLDDLPSWCPPIEARTGWLVDESGRMHHAEDSMPVTLLSFDGSQRPHPYCDPATGEGWHDDAELFLRFSAGVAALARERKPDIVHVNDWHTAAALALLPPEMGSVLTVHNLAFQGKTFPGWRHCFEQFDLYDQFISEHEFNPLGLGISIADRVVMVSESYTDEALSEAGGFGLHGLLAARGEAVKGIRNGIDIDLWNPADDQRLPVNFDREDLTGKEICRKELLRLVGLEPDRGPVIGMVCRLAHQKGVDLALELVPFLDSLSARMVLMGSGSPALADEARRMADAYPEHFAALTSYDDDTAHLVVAGSDLFLVPSRFEPCGLTQMQAMTCGTIPVVSAVGGLRDTVIDTDADPRAGTGYVARRPGAMELLDALHRATNGWRNVRRRAAVQRRGMTADWSWAIPAKGYHRQYQKALDDRASVEAGHPSIRRSAARGATLRP